MMAAVSTRLGQAEFGYNGFEIVPVGTQPVEPDDGGARRIFRIDFETIEQFPVSGRHVIHIFSLVQLGTSTFTLVSFNIAVRITPERLTPAQTMRAGL